jgi:type II secretory pathway component PulC
MDKKTSPEDNLLALIKKNKPGRRGPAGKFRLPPAEFLSLNLGKLFTFLLILSLAAAALSLWQTSRYQGETMIPEFNATAAGPLFEQKNPIKPPVDYQQVVSSRRLFGAADTQKTAEKHGPSANEIIAGLNLQGIVAGLEPKAMIEDKKNQKSYYVKEGEYVGEVQVKKIGEGKVTLELNGEDFSLSL